MKLHLNQNPDLNLVRTCASDRIIIGEEVYRSSLILTPDRIITAWPPASVAALTREDFVLLLGLDPEVR